MRMAQGNGRAKPDGFLHLNNFCHVKGSGLAGPAFEKVMTERQRQIVEATLIEIAEGQPNPAELYHEKHETIRFRKDFLVDHFRSVVYSVFRSIRKSAAHEVSLAITREEQAQATVRLART